MTSRQQETKPGTAPGNRPWTDTSRPREERISLLLAEMTLEEKVAQLGSAWPKSNLRDASEAPRQDVFTREGNYERAREDGVGHLTRPFGSQPQEPLQAARELAELQQDLLHGTRLGIPAIAHDECLTGFTAYRASAFPGPLAWAATFDPDLVAAMAAAIGAGMRDGGVHQGLAPVLDVVRDHRWGRVEETLGEDPYLVGVMGSAYVRGLQRAGITATLKHFAGYSASQAGRNHAPVHMGPRELHETMLLPFEMAVAAGAGSIMNSYSEIDGIPVAANPDLLTRVLRRDWGFTGVAVSDYYAISFLETTQAVASTPAEAAALALRAGIDIELPVTRSYRALPSLVRDGVIPESLVDQAVARVLGHKLDLGLLDAGWSPTPAAVTGGSLDLDPPANRALAWKLAASSIVLLHNPQGLLPLSQPSAKIAVIGPCADDVRTFFGCYSFPNHVLPSFPELGNGIQALTLREALAADLPDSRVSYHEGCTVSGPGTERITEAVSAARQADLCILAVGDRSGMFGQGTSGEGCDAADLTLPGVQSMLADAVLATGTPTVLVVISGRPYALGRYAGTSAAILQAFLPGEEGGPALARVITGSVNPSGKLPVQIPKDPAINPATYLHPILAGHSNKISNLDPTAQFPFGHGLSYTSFEYTDLQVSGTAIGTADAVTVSATVSNTGSRAGTEIVQLYFRDPVCSVTRPVRQLLGFARLPLEPGEARTVSFDVHSDRFAFVGPDLVRVVEPGTIELQVGSSSTDIRLSTTIELTGHART
ncbi:MAG: glycoside hydrolase family 3 C-terminal domain-containing protein, partial [Actinobacteria bacterium]|nr:glycoside hydrolase family 3 C-terminal domain-containing protein [Actinomycetota bacterium]